MSNSPQNQDSLEEELKATFDSDNSDKNYNALKALVSSVPAVGSLATGFFDSYFVPPAMQRIENFLKTLVRELGELKFKIESVDFESPVFTTTLLHACQIATRTHKEQKLEALRNVVLNSSIPSSLEDDILEMFLNWIDGFTEIHIFTLKHLHYIDTYAPMEVDTYFPLSGNRNIYNQVLKDLDGKGLINLKKKYVALENEDYDDGIYSKMKIDKYEEDIDSILEDNYMFSIESKSTELGKQFIKFIENPNPSIEVESR